MGILRADRIAGLGGANAITGSVYFGNSGTSIQANDHIITEPSSDFTMGTGDFTLEGWFFVSSTAPDWQSLIGDTLYGDTGGFTFYVQNNGDNGRLNFWKGGSSVISGGTVRANTWHHLAFSRTGGTNRVYVDGVLGGVNGSDTTNYTDNELSIGANNVDKGGVIGAYGLNGFASNVRVTKGTALYTSAFTPPTVLEKRSDTVLLCCQSCGNVEQEATGKRIIGKGNAAASHFTPNSPVGFSTTTDVGSQYGAVFDGFSNFSTSTYMVPPSGNTRERNRGRAIMAGGMMYPTISGEEIDMLEIQSGGFTQAFGDLTVARSQSAPMSSSTRAVIGAGMDGGTRKNEIDFVTIASTGNATDFGDVSEAISYLGGVSNQTRGLICGGNGPSSPSSTNQIEYVTIATAGDSVDFGILTRVTNGLAGSGSPTRGLLFGGYVAPTVSDTIDYVTIASTGNATDFGNATVARAAGASCSSATRAIFGGGYSPSPSPGTELNVIDFVTIASTGDAQDFGDLSVVGGYLGATSDGTRGIFGSRMTNQPYTGDPTIDTVIIASKGNAVNWGDQERMDSGPHDGQPIVRRSSTTMSDSHGGL